MELVHLLGRGRSPTHKRKTTLDGWHSLPIVVYVYRMAVLSVILYRKEKPQPCTTEVVLYISYLMLIFGRTLYGSVS